MKRFLAPICAVAVLAASLVAGCVGGCPDGSDAPGYRNYPTTNPGQKHPHDSRY